MELHVNSNGVYLHGYYGNNVNLHTFKLINVGNFQSFIYLFIFRVKCAKLRPYAILHKSALSNVKQEPDQYGPFTFAVAQ